MVRVFKCYNFKAARILPIADEPLTIFASGHLVFVATRQCTIKVFKKDENADSFSEWRTFSTICLVEKFAYNKHKNYVITLEQKRSWKSISRYVRLYLNWDMELTKASKQRTKVRIAGKSHSLHASGSYSQQFEVIELPVEGTVTALDVCQLTGNFAIGVGRVVNLFHVMEKTVANSERTYQDVESFLELCWNFEVRALSLSGEYLACCSAKEVQVIIINYAEMDSRQPEKKMMGKQLQSRQDMDQVQFYIPGSSSPDFSDQEFFSSTKVRPTFPLHTKDHHIQGDPFAASSFVDDEFYQEWSFDGDEDLAEDAHVVSGNMSKTIYLKSIHSGTPYPIQGVTPPLLQDYRGGPVRSSSGVSAQTILYVGDLKEQDEWISVTLLPTLISEKTFGSSSSLTLSGGTNPLRSPFLAHRCSVCCYISRQREGYMYRLNPGVALVSSYRYTDTASKVVAGPHLLEVITDTGLETYTARWGSVALGVIEAAEGSGKDQVRPPASLDICMCGIEPFFGAVDVSHGSETIALLTKIDPQKGQEDVQWNLYMLQCSSATDFYKDVMNYAARVQETGPISYLHLLQEAHLYIRWELQRTRTPDPDLADLFQESCALLGEFYSMPYREEWHLCLPYYKMSGLGHADIVRQAIQHREHCKEQAAVYVYGKGLIHYLDWVLYQSDAVLDVRQDIANAVLHIYSKTSPESVPVLILFSELLGYSPENALHSLSEYFTFKESREEQISTQDRLALVKVHLLLCDPEAAEVELSGLDKGKLHSICTAHPELIFTVDEFTPLGQLMRQHTTTFLMSLLAEMLGSGVIMLDACLLLLEKNLDIPRYKNSQVREFLEIVLNDHKRKFCFVECGSILCKIYIQRLLLGCELQSVRQISSPPLKFQLPTGNGHFAVRYAWLDYMPPVHDPSGLLRPCLKVSIATPGSHGHYTGSSLLSVHGGGVEKEETCSCAFCLQDLLKLQSILSSQYTDIQLEQEVLQLIQGRPDMVGWDSVWMLCKHRAQPRDVAEFTVDHYPHIVSKLASSTFRLNLEQWQSLLRCLEERLKEKSSAAELDPSAIAGTSHQKLVTAYQNVLGEMAELFSPEEFLLSLPENGSLTFLLPFITQNLQRLHLLQLKNLIISKGKAVMGQL